MIRHHALVAALKKKGRRKSGAPGWSHFAAEGGPRHALTRLSLASLPRRIAA